MWLLTVVGLSLSLSMSSSESGRAPTVSVCSLHDVFGCLLPMFLTLLST